MENELVRYEPGRTLTPVMNLTLAKSRLAEFQQFVKEYMVLNEDYGQIPGTPKKTLYKPGADKLCELYGLNDSYRIIDRLVDFDRGLFDYEIECTLSRDGQPVATGLGSCSSFEGKYRWRDSKYKCPQCGKETIIKGKEEYGGGWLCFARKGGCGAKFSAGDQTIEGQTMGQVENDDIATLKNTILKMAKKRAKVDAVLAATRSSGVFTQDVGDDEGTKKPAPGPVAVPKRKSESAPASDEIPFEQLSSTPPAQTAPSQPTLPANGNVITEKQVGRLYAIARGAGYTDATFHAALEKMGYKSSKDVTKSNYDDICTFFGQKP